MNSNDYVSIELAKLLKEKGFDEYCDKINIEKIPGTGREAFDMEECQYVTIYDITKTPIPTLWQAAKWLREKKGIAINVIAHDGGKYEYDIVFRPNASDGDGVPDRSPWCRIYEEALSAGIEAALDLLNENRMKL